jgi:hypothetical protein
MEAGGIMGIKIELKTSDLVIETMIKRRIIDRLNNSIEKSIPTVKTQFKRIVRNAIISSETYQSIVQGPDLKGELGVANGASKLERIIKVWLDSLVVKFTRFDPIFNASGGEFTVSMIRGDFKDVINLPAAHHISERVKRDIRWLDWLLTKGTLEMVQHFQYNTNFDPTKYKSRTGLGVMTFKKNAGWHVPTEYAGTEDDNWITKIIMERSPEFTQIIEQEVTKRFYG